MPTYKIVRYYRTAHPNRRTIKRGLTFAQAQEHCRNPETSSSTATGKVAKARTRRVGDWFDGFVEE